MSNENGVMLIKVSLTAEILYDGHENQLFIVCLDFSKKT